ncbi:hypothetical protein COCMIDRAFT_33129 [Bipolaris oryzae ATCC 44560]|uniref:Cupredoxin n=1 Tax=Bipolaris oryzae ATCC 44560 TaxID=930090 RepID=W7A0E0_COCMI|nr:uncharacterized protein COCMIDRAFT_33129 [Bipolaris oryzae ATCC 44560]EUC49491.1 hypothetical protein COCMIDRAFT_33129 [Bipolaris oryzae ATCC 44560]
MYFSTTAIVSAIFGFAAAQGGMLRMHVIQVGGPNGSLAFYPNNVAAQPGDMVQFQFHPKNHSVVQSTFDNPCIPIQNVMPNKTDAFFSGFMPTNASFTATNQVLTYTIRVPDTRPIWFYCSQGQHCQNGMVGAINAPAAGNRTMQAFTALAAQASENLSPGQPAGSGGITGNTPTSPSAGNGANSGNGQGGAAGGNGAGAGAGAGAGSGTGASPPQTTTSNASGLGSQSFISVAAAFVAIAFASL